jgi:hydrophobe/amphiphile efflux-3 (HAE3) family protein
VTVTARFITQRPWWTIAVVSALTLFALSRIVDFSTMPPRMLLEFDSSVDRLLGAGEERRLLYERTRQLFGEDNVLVVALAADDVFVPEVLATVKRLGDRLAEVEGVDRVVSLFSALHVRRRQGDLVIEPFLARVPESAATDVRERVLANPVYAGNLVSRSGRATALIVHLEKIPELDPGPDGIDERIQRVIAEERGDLEAWITGSRHVGAVTIDLLLSDMKRIIPLGLAFLALVVFLSFRTVRGVLVPLLCIAIANLWTLGTMAWLGYPLHLVTAVVPALIQTVGITYTMHVVSEYYDQLIRGDTTDPAGHALRDLTTPLLLTAFTTAAGLSCLMLTPLPAVREFGMFSVIGVIYSAILAATFVPAALSLGVERARERAPRHERFDRFAARVARFDLRHRRAIFAVAGAIFAISLVGMTRIHVNTDFVSNFPSDHPVRRDFEAIGEHLDGAAGISVVLEATSRDAFKEPANLREVESLQRWLEAQPEVGSTTSLVDYVRVIHAGFLGEVPEATGIPDSKRLISQLLFFSADPELRRLVDSAYAGTNILVRYRTLDSSTMSAFLDRLEAHLARLPEHIKGGVTGETVLLARTVDGVSRGQVRSITLAFLVIFASLAVLFGSLRVGVLALIPNVLPVAFYFGLLGLVGVSLNPTTSVIACLALGVAVDDTIHFFARFRGVARTVDEEEAAVSALRIVGRPITVTSVALVLGLGAAMTAQLKNQADFGALTAITLAYAWVVDVLVTPGIAARAHRRARRSGAKYE